jgi:hypothetical protein
MSLKSRLDRLERRQPPARSFMGSPRFWACLAGSYEPTAEEQAEMEVVLAAAPPVDAVERELERLIAELPRRCGLKELPPSSSPKEGERIGPA